MQDNHEGGAYLQVLVKIYEEENMGQALIEIERKDEVFFSFRNMVDHIQYGSENKIPCSSIDWVDRGTLGGKEFYFRNNCFIVTDIVLTCEQQQGIILHILGTYHTHAHEVNSDLHVLEEFEVKQYEDQ